MARIVLVRRVLIGVGLMVIALVLDPIVEGPTHPEATVRVAIVQVVIAREEIVLGVRRRIEAGQIGLARRTARVVEQAMTVRAQAMAIEIGQIGPPQPPRGTGIVILTV